MSIKFISIIIPHFNDKIRLLNLLKELDYQVLSNAMWEVIVVNNDFKFPLELPDWFSVSYRLKIIEESIPGSYSARNKGIKEAKGDLLAFTDSDCLPDKYWLKNAFTHFNKDNENNIGVLTGPVPLFFRDRSNLSAAETYEKYTGFTTKVYALDGKAITANWFSYASVIDEFGGFDPTLKSNGDSKLSGQISSKYSISFQEDVIVYHPSRYLIKELTCKFKRLLGGTYTRNYQGRNIPFFGYLVKFIFKRYRFAIKKLFTVNINDSIKIIKVCHFINIGVILEYMSIIKGNPTKR
ncbi:hypothetical protein GCM10027284_25290 [Cyclobacterium sediminis]